MSMMSDAKSVLTDLIHITFIHIAGKGGGMLPDDPESLVFS